MNKTPIKRPTENDLKKILNDRISILDVAMGTMIQQIGIGPRGIKTIRTLKF